MTAPLAIVRRALVLSLTSSAFWLVGCPEPPVQETVEPSEEETPFVSLELDQRLDAAAAGARERGFTAQSGEPWRGFIVDGGTEVQELDLRSGRCHAFIVVGSSAIENLRMTLHDSEGVELLRADGGLQHCPSQSGVYFLALRSTGSGLFAARRFEGPAGLDLRLEDLIEPSVRP